VASNNIMSHLPDFLKLFIWYESVCFFVRHFIYKWIQEFYEIKKLGEINTTFSLTSIHYRAVKIQVKVFKVVMPCNFAVG